MSRPQPTTRLSATTTAFLHHNDLIFADVCLRRRRVVRWKIVHQDDAPHPRWTWQELLSP